MSCTEKSIEHFQSADLRMRYDFIRSLTGEFSVEILCAVLAVSRTAYYRYQRGASYHPSAAKEESKKLVETVFEQHKRRYGNRRIVAELQKQGHKIGREQVRTLIKQSHLQPIQPKSFVPRTTDSTHGKGVLA